MKTKFFINLLVVLSIAAFYSCDEEEGSVEFKTKTETISMGASYVTDVYYSLKNGVVAQVTRANWDIALSVSARSSSILINGAAGIELKAHPLLTSWTSSQSTDTTGYSTWSKLINSDISWEEGAFGQNATGHPNYGWGIYNATTHNVEGSALYIIKLQNGSFKKIFIEIKDATNKQYKFKFANLDGTNEVSQTVSFATATSNYIYFSIANNAVVNDYEPATADWDLIFTKWIDNTLKYPVTGVLQNLDVEVIDLAGVNVDIDTYTDTDFSADINTIGYDWKSFNMNTYQYEIPTDRVFFVKNKDLKVFKIVFKTFEGSSTGKITFDITQIK